MHKNEDRPRLPRGGPALFARRARIWIVALVAICLFSFVLIPLLLNRSIGANAVYVSAGARFLPEPSPTPAVQALLAAEPEDEAAPEPSPTSEIQVSQYSLLQENDDYPAVQKLQVRLMELGYLDSDEPSTYFGAATSSAVSLVQRTMS
ncbi:MAG: peptidoglycan-binding domain-containing protein, partial [Clostridia bacterium]|nr:peptidoglycan-binding domain-containing protein [Clostridia bacterium]